MEGTPAVYLGRIVSKDNFRVFIYSPVGTRKLVETWLEYEKCMATGNWFATKAEVEEHQASLVVQKTKRRQRGSKATTAVEMLEKDEDSTDDFLPKEC